NSLSGHTHARSNGPGRRHLKVERRGGSSPPPRSYQEPEERPVGQEGAEMSERGAVRGRDALLATKLYVPRGPAGFVARSRLTVPLGDGPAGRTVLVCAPAGVRKTALLAAWASGGPRPVAWLSLDEGDNDPARFWRHVAAALDRVRPGVRGRVGPLLGPPPPQSFEGVVTALLNELAERPAAEQPLLVLDDYHLIAA